MQQNTQPKTISILFNIQSHITSDLWLQTIFGTDFKIVSDISYCFSFQPTALHAPALLKNPHDQRLRFKIPLLYVSRIPSTLSPGLLSH